MEPIKLNKVIPSIEKVKLFDKFIDSDYEYCILMNFHLSMVESLVKKAHQQQKKVIVHIDLTHGISNDEFGVEYLCQKLKVDGIISTKRKCVETAKRCHKLTILRVFLIDSKSLEQGIDLANSLKPDFLEVLPAIAYSIFNNIKSRCSIPLIGGGLIKSKSELEKALNSGLEAVSLTEWDKL